MSSVPMVMQSMYIRSIAELPPHVTYDQYLKIRDIVAKYWDRKNMTEERVKLKDRDTLFITMLWELGGRVSDICNLPMKNINLQQRKITMFVQKRKKTFEIPISSDLALDISVFKERYRVQDKKPLFEFGRKNAWYLIKRYSKKAGIENIHPHMFRHGLAIHLLNNEVPIPVISARLCHANVFVTMQHYMKITPEMQRGFLDKVKLREDVIDVE